MSAVARIRRVGRAGWSLTLPAVAAGQIFVLDGMWVDASFEREPVRLTTVFPALYSEAERQQRIAVATQYLHAPPASPRDIELARTLLGRAEEAIRSGDFRQALQRASDGLALHPTSPALLSRAAIAAAGVHDYALSEQYFARYLEQNPGDAEHLAGHAGVLIRLARFDEADKLIRRGLRQNPDHLRLRFNEALLLTLREAQEFPLNYWRLRSVDELAVLLKWLMADRAEFERMIGAADYRRLCETILGPGTAKRLPEIRRDLAEASVLLQRRQYAPARAALDRARGRGLHAYGVAAAAAQTLQAEGRGEEALRRWEQLTNEFGDLSQAWFDRGRGLLRADRPAEAIPPLLRGLELAPDDPGIRFVLACAFALSGAIDEAQAIFDQLIVSHSAQVRRWIQGDPVLEHAVRSVPRGPDYWRTIQEAPASE